MNDKVLFVDDDANLLASYQRQLRGKFAIETSSDAQQGLEAIRARGPYSVIVSDFRMPGMDGVEFLARAREGAPDSVRMLLTGYADLQTAIDAVNQGNIFRLLTKPCQPDVLISAITAGIAQYQLIRAERELLEKTLTGGIKVLCEVLSLLNPEAFGRASRITRYARQMASEMGQSEMWEIETAAMLSQIGCIILPEEILKKVCQGQKLTAEEAKMFEMHPSIASDLIIKIPRLEKIAEIIAYQEKHFDGSGIPADSRQGEEIPLGARLIKVSLDFDGLVGAGHSKGRALEQLLQRTGWYDPRVLAALEAVIGIEAKYEVKSVRLWELAEKMIFADDIKSDKGVLIIAKGQEVTRPLLAHLRNFTLTSKIKEPIRVIVPIKKEPRIP